VLQVVGLVELVEGMVVLGLVGGAPAAVSSGAVTARRGDSPAAAAASSGGCSLVSLVHWVFDWF
jgi:hypothetical protein